MATLPANSLSKASTVDEYRTQARHSKSEISTSWTFASRGPKVRPLEMKRRHSSSDKSRSCMTGPSAGGCRNERYTYAEVSAIRHNVAIAVAILVADSVGFISASPALLANGCLGDAP